MRYEAEVPVDRLVPHLDNPRTHAEESVTGIAESIRRFGFRVPVVANERTGVIEAGHGRLLAARRLGLKVVPVIWANDDEETALAFTLSDNRVAELSDWDPAKLSALLSDYEGESLDLMGLSEDWLAGLLKEFEREKRKQAMKKD